MNAFISNGIVRISHRKVCTSVDGRVSLFDKAEYSALTPISELTKRGSIKHSGSLDELEKSVCEFLGINSPQETPQIAVNFRHSQILEPEENAKIAWCKRVEQIVRKQQVRDFNREKLKKAIPELLKYAAREEDINFVPSFLLKLGVHFVIIPHLKKTYLDGAAFYVEDRPVIALTLRHNRIDNL